MRFEAHVALRYLKGKRKSRFISLITLISVAGVTVGVMALIVVMGVMTGFDNELQATIIGNEADVRVYDRVTGRFTDPDAVIREVEALCPEIVMSSPFTRTGAVLRGPHSPDYEFLWLIGVDTQRETDVTHLAENLTRENGRTRSAGRLPGKWEIVLGYMLAERLSAGVGDRITILVPSTRPGLLGQHPVQRELTVSGISQAQFTTYDDQLGFVDIDTGCALRGRGSGVDGIHCKLKNHWDAKNVAERIEWELGYGAMTWYESQETFFEALKQEKVAMFIILIFIILVAAFNIASTLIMVVMEKRRDIGILRTLGVSGPAITRIFMLEGLYIGLSGTALGVLFGTLLAFNLTPVVNAIGAALGLDVFNSGVYYFDRIPVAVTFMDVVWITICAVVLTFLSTLYPAWSASRLDPVDALRYE